MAKRTFSGGVRRPSGRPSTPNRRHPEEKGESREKHGSLLRRSAVRPGCLTAALVGTVAPIAEASEVPPPAPVTANRGKRSSSHPTTQSISQLGHGRGAQVRGLGDDPPAPDPARRLVDHRRDVREDRGVLPAEAIPPPKPTACSARRSRRSRTQTASRKRLESIGGWIAMATTVASMRTVFADSTARGLRRRWRHGAEATEGAIRREVRQTERQLGVRPAQLPYD